MTEETPKCALCGLELPLREEGSGQQKKFHDPCRKAHHNLAARIRAKHGDEYNEAVARVVCLIDDAEWLLEIPSREVKAIVGERGQDVILDAAIRLSEIRGMICKSSSRG